MQKNREKFFSIHSQKIKTKRVTQKKYEKHQRNTNQERTSYLGGNEGWRRLKKSQ